MRIRRLIVTTFIVSCSILGAPIHSSFAVAAACNLDGVVLVCGEAKDTASIAEAFAAAETRTTLSSPINQLDRFKHPSDLEKFRTSVEKSWRQVQRAERKQRNRMLRRQISADAFEEWYQTYDNALETYRQAIIFYRTLVWHGKNGKPAPVDSDS